VLIGTSFRAARLISLRRVDRHLYFLYGLALTWLTKICRGVDETDTAGSVVV
jgi:hypothetical protein